MDFDFEDVFKSIKTEVINLAKNTLNDSFKEAEADGLDALNTLKANIKQWSLELAKKELSMDDFKFLLEGQKEEMEMESLKEAGLKEIELDKFKNGIVGIVVNKISGLI